MEPILVAALVWLALAVAAWHVPQGVPAIWKLRSRRDSQWPTGVQEENDERPWYRRQGVPAWRSRPRGRAPELEPPPPTLERVRRQRTGAR